MAAGAPLVVVVGSLHYDIVVEAPHRPRTGETVAGRRWFPSCGGKGGNQAVAAARAGVRTAMVGAVADDGFGRALVANLAGSGVDHRFVRVVQAPGSGISVAIVDRDGDYGAVIVSGANLSLGQADIDAAAGLFSRGAVLVLQNEVPDRANVAAARAMRDAGGRVILNAAPARELPAELAPLVDVLVVNAVEAEQMGGLPPVEGLAAALAAARALTAVCPVVVVTAGGAGVACASRGGDAITLPALEVVLVSTHGAGDAFTGTLAAGLARGLGLEAATDAANRAAALLVGTAAGARAPA